MSKISHIYNNSSFGENWFGYEQVYSMLLEKTPDNGHIVEVGSWKGKSASYLAVEIHNSGKKIRLDCVDTWLGSTEHQNDEYVKSDTLYNLFLTNIEPVKHIINPVRMDSCEAYKLYQDESIDAIFIDAAHDYDSVKKDIVRWLNKVKRGGILAGHDYTTYWPGVVAAVNEILGKSNILEKNQCWVYHNR